MRRLIGGRFVKKRVPGMRKHGQYRGKGSLEISEAGVQIRGKHVYSLGLRWALGAAFAVGVVVLTLGTLVPGIPLIYPVVEYLLLAKGDQIVTFDRVEAYNVVPDKELVAIQFAGTRWETPVVLRSHGWRVIYDELTARIPRARVAEPKA